MAGERQRLSKTEKKSQRKTETGRARENKVIMDTIIRIQLSKVHFKRKH